ncbi:MAG TPA: Ig-like domain-containing protein, partial [Rhodothermales bacterium]|nr:Ig-like domain-containing protein [Rhodothermales bacterium]
NGLPINGAVVTMGGRADTTDTYEKVFRFYSNDPNELRNGFFYLEDVPAGTGNLQASAPNYRSTTVSVTPVDTFFTIQDLTLVSTAPLALAERTPVPGATNVRVVDPITLVFNRPADTASVRAALTIRRVGGAAIPGTMTWSSGNRRLTFYPAQPLQEFTEHEVVLAATAASPYGFALDGNGDGTPGDGIAYRFTSGPADVNAPSVAGVYPANNGRNVELFPLLSVTFDEEVVASSYQTSAVTLARSSDGAAVPVTVRPSLVRGQTVLHIVPGAVLQANTFYRLTLPAGMADRFGNSVPNARTITFQTGAIAEDRTYVEQFEADFAANWWAPTQSGSTTQAALVVDSTGMEPSSIGNPITGSAKAMQLRFGFKTDTSGHLIREFLNSGPAFAARFDTSHTLQAYVHGDGSGVLFRFAVDDGCTGSSCAGTEVSPWTAVTWRGWRKVEWDLGSTPPGSWLTGQNGKLDGQLRFDSFQLSYAPGSPAFGRILLDDLAFVRTRLVTGVEAAPPADGLAFDGVAPNPVGARGVVRFRLPEPVPVTLDVFDALGRRVAQLVSGEALSAGAHERVWETGGLAPGLYVLRLTAGANAVTTTAVVGR